MKLPDGGKLVSWTGFIFGTAVSVAANVLAARIPPDHAASDWTPRTDTQLGSAVWPLALLLSIEVLARVAWPKGVWWNVARFGGLSIVASGAFVISYQHINHVLASWGYEWLSQGVGPLVIDGLMVICGVAMLAKPGALRKLLAGKDAPERRDVIPEVPKPMLRPLNEPNIGGPSKSSSVEDSTAPAELEHGVPAQRNGHRVSAALKTGPKPRKTSGQSDEEIATLLRGEIERDENPDLTKRGVMTRFGVGAPRWTKITELLKKEES